VIQIHLEIFIPFFCFNPPLASHIIHALATNEEPQGQSFLAVYGPPVAAAIHPALNFSMKKQ